MKKINKKLLAIQQDNNVSQIFILTHNGYFHANVTPEYENNYSAVNFYQITKNANQPHIKVRTKTKDSENYNVNPIKNSYAALWRELDCNIIHRILGYYFLKITSIDKNQSSSFP